ncbi:MAG TPA: hypothetical protein VKS82_24215 [Streptosporangiaceae bacterium]|nr:hypothetical protein [Streptosporangiaceae bacterium]
MRALESLPPGHPSSPYLADGSRRPPARSLRSLELPFPDEAATQKPGTADNLAAEPTGAPQSDTPGRPEGRHRSYWTEVPHFERKWAEHEREWPKHEQPAATVDRSHDPPGSWRSDSNLLLSPQDNARSKEAIDRVQAAEPRVTADLGEVARKSAFGGELVGLEFRYKGEDRLKEKVAENLQRRPDMAPEEAMLEISDAIRYTVRFSHENYVGGYKDVSERLTESGYSLFYAQNHWEDPEYKGINTRWTTPEGNRFEVQFHTRESYHAKQEVTHEAYERIRNPLTSDDERSALKTFQRDVSSWIPVPEGSAGIPDLRKDPF